MSEQTRPRLWQTCVLFTLLWAFCTGVVLLWLGVKMDNVWFAIGGTGQIFCCIALIISEEAKL
jgi:hypothetical protein